MVDVLARRLAFEGPRRLPPQISSRPEMPSPEQIKPVENQGSIGGKPRIGGLWTSSYDERTGSDWIRWSRSERWGYASRDEAQHWLLQPKPCRVLEIGDPTMLRHVTLKYPGSEYMPIDWERVAQDYDCAHFPDPWTHRFESFLTNSEEDLALGMFFYSLDAESTIWFRWCFEEVVEPQHGLSMRVAVPADW